MVFLPSSSSICRFETNGYTSFWVPTKECQGTKFARVELGNQFNDFFVMKWLNCWLRVKKIPKPVVERKWLGEGRKGKERKLNVTEVKRAIPLSTKVRNYNLPTACLLQDGSPPSVGLRQQDQSARSTNKISWRLLICQICCSFPNAWGLSYVS